MARFFGSVQGARGGVHRLGGASSGMRVIAAGWQGAVSVHLYDDKGVDCAIVRLAPWQGHGTDKVLYDGPVAGKKKPRR